MKVLEIFDKVRKAPYINFGELFGNAFALFQKVWLQGLLLQVLTIAVSYGLMVIAYIPILASVFIVEGNGSGSGSDLGYIILGIFGFLLLLVIIILMAMFQLALQASFYKIVRIKDRDINKEAGVGFGMYIKKKYIKKILVLTMAQVGVVVLSSFLFLIPLLYVVIPLQFVIIIFAFNPEWSVNDIYKAAFKLGTKKWGITMGAGLLLGIIALIVGFMACFIGIYATLSIVYLPIYLVYKEVVGFTEDDDLIAEIGV